MVYKYFDKKTAESGIKSLQQNELLTEELHKPIIRKLNKKEKYIQHLKAILGVADLADMQLISKFNKGFRFLLCAIDISSKYAWVVPLKDKKGVSIFNTFQKLLDDSKRKPNKIWIDKGSEFYNRSMKPWLQDNDIAMYSTHNEGKSVVDERFIRKDLLLVDEYNNTYHRTIKMKPSDVKDNAYINIGKEVNDNDPKFKAGDHVRISKYKNSFAKGYTPNWSEEIFGIKKIKNTVPWTYVNNDLNGEEIIGTLYEKELQKANKKEFRIEKLITKKGNKLYVKWKGYDNSFESWIDKKDLV